jgi:uncharacterized repeat protein (TIGR01451 family)
MTLLRKQGVIAGTTILIAAALLLMGNQRLAFAASTTSTSTPQNGVLVIKKAFASGTTTPDAFSFSINGGPQTSFATSAVNTLSVATGTYSVIETATSTYTASYSGCSSIVISAQATSTCTITNALVGASSASTSDLSIVKSVNNGIPNLGDQVTYTLSVTNAGPANASGVSVIDILGSGLSFVADDASSTINGSYASSTGIWTIGSLSSGSSTALHITARVNSGTAGQKITNSATVANTNGDPVLSNNTAVVTLTITNPSATSTQSGAGNGPIVGLIGTGLGTVGTPAGAVLGLSTSTIQMPCDQYITGFMKMGANNDPEQVRRMQTILKTNEGASVTINGVFDQATLDAVKVFSN